MAFLTGRKTIALGFLALLAAIAVFALPSKIGNSDALWQIVSQQCVPNQQRTHSPQPCVEVDISAGFVVYKDRNGPLQYLLMPIRKISGIESPELLEPKTPNYFLQAWQARHYMADKYGSPIEDRDISLAVNSEFGRSQNQLHIHISCLSPTVKKALIAQSEAFRPRWQPLPDGLLGHNYLVRRISVNELAEQGAFRLLASGVQDAAANMGKYGLAMTALPNGEFLLLATKRNLPQRHLASIEEIQDHSCSILPRPPR
ncbi:CDP-diacylglycerol diphosphatase [Yersinia ruckeri]|uniref:CDP-diacylglycerol diphosphatase n=1 Tax=Yersinia ruckeri TaxID=29486 RepID=UPI0004E33299|nr:CDP-diacylglycerol diphosphatase [Yersinia ruckeri]AKA38822.1 CDP-diacylglycerol pyrophosphatase [Yersinia ruckeri]ARY99464.1 CDP-diacylglycerol pyrophosphatase [Yersinia ruckeri]AUQ41639.1 CDP-diacylglycerol diphosphatase [Yersinia ruckeri]EKN4182698.1 CDP-diacylglycerol diphosphatase [Yersinia ruckeri]EKN4687512.1 CDP-diacylglycerol diphosphatase [Yersinia ruckeri]